MAADSTEFDTPMRAWIPAFLVELATNGNVSAAASAVGIERTTAYAARNADPEFLAAWEQAEAEAADRLEAEAWRRAVNGVVEPVFGSLGPGAGTGEVGTIRKYSDTLIALLLKAHKPKKYRERVEHSTPDGQSLFKVYVGIDTDKV